MQIGYEIEIILKMVQLPKHNATLTQVRTKKFPPYEVKSFLKSIFDLNPTRQLNPTQHNTVNYGAVSQLGCFIFFR